MPEDKNPGREVPPEVQRIVDVGETGFLFGVHSVKHCGAGLLKDEDIMFCFLHYTLGAVRWLGDNMDPDDPLDDKDKLSAMAVTLKMQGGGADDDEQVLATVAMLDRAGDETALRMQRLGAEAVSRWQGGANPDAAREFRRLLNEQPGLFLRRPNSS